MYWSGAEWWAWIPMTVVMVVLWGLLVWAALQLVGWRRGDERRPRDTREILDERLARGEIDIDEYEERRAAIEARNGSRATAHRS